MRPTGLFKRRAGGEGEGCYTRLPFLSDLSLPDVLNRPQEERTNERTQPAASLLARLARRPQPEVVGSIRKKESV